MPNCRNSVIVKERGIDISPVLSHCSRCHYPAYFSLNGRWRHVYTVPGQRSHQASPDDRIQHGGK